MCGDKAGLFKILQHYKINAGNKLTKSGIVFILFPNLIGLVVWNVSALAEVTEA